MHTKRIICTTEDSFVQPRIRSTLVQENVRTFIETQLPADEASRVPLLPWDAYEDDVFNAQIARVYIPHTAVLVDSLATPNIWSDLTQLLALLDQLTQILLVAPLLDITPGIFDDSTSP